MTILITGANSGFGLLATERLARAGVAVAAGYRNRARADALFALAEAGLPVTPVRLDVTDTASIAAAVGGVPDLTGLVNNAGFEVRGPIEAIDDETYRRQFDTNVLGMIRMVRAAGPALRAARGVIVNLSSVVGIITPPFAGLYAASKHAVEAISEALFIEMAPFGVRVRLIEPGAFPTSFGANEVLAPGFDESSPHWATANRFWAALGPLSAGSSTQDPGLVAEAIARAVTEPATPFRQLVGADAEGMVPMRRAAPDFETFVGAVMGQLGVSDLLPAG